MLAQEVVMEAEDVSLYYGDFQALEHIDMKIFKNKITALIGPSGSGKSTFLKTLNRMNDLVEDCRITGKIYFQDRDIYDNEQTDINKLRREVGMVFQQPNPFPMSIYDNIAFGPRTHGHPSKDELTELVETSLKKVGIWDEVKDKLKSNAIALSGGQQQRVCIARALAVKPDVLLMDEPTSALDPISTAKIETLVRELAENYTIVIVTHNMQQAARLSDYTAFFYADPAKKTGSSEVIEFDHTKTLFTNPHLNQTKAYIEGQFG